MGLKSGGLKLGEHYNIFKSNQIANLGVYNKLLILETSGMTTRRRNLRYPRVASTQK
jgi:hypothetical protein